MLLQTAMNTIHGEDDKGNGNNDHRFWTTLRALGTMETIKKTETTKATAEMVNDEDNEAVKVTGTM